jgi:hypothetical protein
MHIPSSKTVDLVLTYLKRHPEGVSHARLLEKLNIVANPVELTAALTALLNGGAVLYSYRASEGEFPLEDEVPRGQLAYFANNDYLTTVADPAEVEYVLSFIVANQELGPVIGTAITLDKTINEARYMPIRATSPGGECDNYVQVGAVAAVYERFAAEMILPKIGFILDLLRTEAVIQFSIDSNDGTATLLLMPQHKYTVIAQDLVQQSLRWFHVRAGTEAKAIEKVQTIPEGARAVLDITGTVPGWLVYTPAPTKRFCIERL